MPNKSLRAIILGDDEEMPAEGDEGEETGQLLEMMHEGYFSQFELPFFFSGKITEV